MNFLLHLLATLLIFLTLDVVWLKYIIGEMVEWPWIRHFGYPPNWPWAELYYGAMSVLLTFRCAYKSMLVDDASPAFADGARLGFGFSVIYACVNTLFFYPWPLELMLLDIGWNTLLCAVTAVFSYAIGNWLTADEMGIRKV